MVRIRWTILATSDLKGIFEYIALDSKRYAKIQVVKLRARSRVLKSNPTLGRIVPEYDQPNYRELIEGNYRIIYKIVDQSTIDILTVHHSSRDLMRREIE